MTPAMDAKTTMMIFIKPERARTARSGRERGARPLVSAKSAAAATRLIHRTND
jgi:hypothetical protein